MIYFYFLVSYIFVTSQKDLDLRIKRDIITNYSMLLATLCITEVLITYMWYCLGKKTISMAEPEYEMIELSSQIIVKPSKYRNQVIFSSSIFYSATSSRIKYAIGRLG